MQMTPVSYDGTNLVSAGTYNAWFKFNTWQQPPQGRAELVYRPDNSPTFAGVQVMEKRLLLSMSIENGDPDALKPTLNQLFSPRNKNLRTLIVKDEADSDKQYQIQCWPEHIIPIPEGSKLYEVMLLCPDWPWETVDNVQGTVASAAAGTLNWTGDFSGSNYAPDVTITFTPAGAAGATGYTYHRFVTVKNRANRRIANHPLNVAGTGWDTSTEVGAGKMQADGDDLRVFIGGNEHDRWLDNINAANTKVWTTVSLSANKSMTFGTVTAGTTTLNILDTAANRDALSKIPNQGWFELDSEQVEYTAKDESALTLTVTRGERGTTAAAHAEGVSGDWIEHNIVIVYGKTSASAPTVDQGNKPMFDLEQSTNVLWYFTEFRDYAYPRRPASWDKVIISSRAQQSLYTGLYDETQKAYVDTEDGTVTAAGCLLSSYPTGDLYTAEEGHVLWELSNPCRFDGAGGTGVKRREISTWAERAGITGRTTNTKFNTLSVSTPSSASAWEGWNTASWPSTDSLSANHKKVQFEIKASVAAGSANYLAADATIIVVDLVDGRVPSVSLGAEEAASDAYHLLGTFYNVDNGQSFTLDLPMERAKAVVVSVADSTVKKGNQNVYSALRSLNTRRSRFLEVTPGGVVNFRWIGSENLAIAVTWKDKKA